MKQLLALAAALGVVGLVLVAFNPVSLAQFSPIVQGPTGAPPPAFTGIGDVSSTGIIAHGGSIAFKSSTRGATMYSICDNATGGSGTCKNIATDASTGLVSSTQGVGSIGACGTGGNQCYVDVSDDDTGANKCTGSAPCHASVASSQQRPKFIPNGVGTLPTVRCLLASSHELDSTAFVSSVPVPYTFLLAGSIPTQPPASAAYMIGFGSAVDAVGGFANSGANGTYMYSGAVMSAGTPMAANTMTALISVAPTSGNGTIAINGTTSSPGSPGTTTGSSGVEVCDAFTGAFRADMDFLEWAVYGSNQAANIATLTSAMRTNGGY